MNTPEAPTAPRVELSLDEALILDEMLDEATPPPVCEYNENAGPKCGALASWIMTKSCGHDVYLDEPHYGTLLAFVDSPEAIDRGIRCIAPGHPPVSVVVEFVRIAS